MMSSYQLPGDALSSLSTVGASPCSPEHASPPAPRTQAAGRWVRNCHRLLGWLAPQRAARRWVDRRWGPADANGRPHPSFATDAFVRRMQSPLPADVRTWGDPDHQPYVLFALGEPSASDPLASWLDALHDSGQAVVAFACPQSWPGAGYPDALPGMARELLRIGRRYGRAEAVIGHSLGAAAAVAALAQGLEARRAVLIAAQADPHDAVRRFGERVGVGQPVIRHMADLIEQRMGVAMESLQAHRIAPVIGVPALVVHDLLDDEVPWAEGERYARYLSQSRLLTTFDLGHRDIFGDPGVVRAALRFLAGERVGDRVVSSTALPYGLA